MHLHIGTTLQGGKYRITEVLGQGGFGITYLAVQNGLERKSRHLYDLYVMMNKDFTKSAINNHQFGHPFVIIERFTHLCMIWITRQKFAIECNWYLVKTLLRCGETITKQ